MSLQEFRASPWKISHRAYEGSSFNIRPAPEFATAEVVLASTYRASGFHGYAERDVPQAGRNLDRAASKNVPNSGLGQISSETWRTIIYGVMESPKRPKQSSKRFLQLCPLVPDVSLYSGSARLVGNSWNPGLLVERMIQMGSESAAGAAKVWNELHLGLSVRDDDDVWARWLQAEFERRRDSVMSWQSSPISAETTLPEGEGRGLRFPSLRFVRDLSAVLRAKPFMTRRQWVSLLESILRLGTTAHVLWLCDVNDRLWRDTARVLRHEASAPLEEAVRSTIVGGHHQRLVYGQPALPIVRDLASRYLEARLGLNLTLWHLSSTGFEIESMSSVADLARFLRIVEERRETMGEILSDLERLTDEHTRTLTCKKGIGANLMEFCRYTMGQRETADPNLRGYDQGYLLKKRADYKSAPWIVSLGPAALLALVHCCLEEVAGPRSVQRFCEHLAWYGLDVDRDTVAKSDLGKNLRMLGLVLDSPDAESGMLLVPPFELAVSAVGRVG